ncbi:hypothetical protein HDU76_000969 [Blyttiomyces sp. JEL0837]|nr:hypothetical protein HDU76_000969 [Blyttiomyces sp. JEL0837]
MSRYHSRQPSQQPATSWTSRFPQKVLHLIFAESHNPSVLLQTCTAFRKISKNDLVRASWLLKHPNVLSEWCWSRLLIRPKLDHDYLEHVEKVSTTTVPFPESLFNENVIALLLDSVATIASDVETVAAVTMAIWSSICLSQFSDLALTIFACSVSSNTPPGTASTPTHQQQDSRLSGMEEPAPLDPVKARRVIRSLDDDSWRETLYLAVASDEETPQLLRLLITDQSLCAKIQPFALEGLQLAARVGSLPAVQHLAKAHLGVDMASSGNNLILLAAAHGHWSVVLYIVGLTGFKEAQEGLLKTYRGLFILSKSAEQDVLDPVDGVLETWRAEEAADPETTDETVKFSWRWSIAAEMAAEKGHRNLLMRLLDARTPEEIPKIKLTIRVLALAVANNHKDVGEYILSDAELFRTEEAKHYDDWKDDILNGLGNPASRSAFNVLVPRELLLLRYCVIKDEDLAGQLALAPPASGKNQEFWKQQVAAHRCLIVRFLFTGNKRGVTISPLTAQDALWKSFKEGHMKLAEALRDLGVTIGWMENENIDDQQASEFKAWGSSNVTSTGGSAVNSNLSMDLAGPPAIARALFAGLGGSWFATTNEMSGTSKFGTNLDVGALVIAAEVAKDEKRLEKKYSVEDYQEASRRLSVDGITQIHPRLLVDPKDDTWTAFLAGSLPDTSASGSKDMPEFAWMEPKRSDSISFRLKKGSASGSTDLGTDDSLDTQWKKTLGTSFDGDDSALSMFLGLGGVLPERKEKPEKKTDSPHGSMPRSRAVKRLLKSEF